MKQQLDQVSVEDCLVHTTQQAQGIHATWRVTWIADFNDSPCSEVRTAVLDRAMGVIVQWYFPSDESDHARSTVRYLPDADVLKALRDLLPRLEHEFPGIRLGIPHERHTPDSVPAIWAFVPVEGIDAATVVPALLARLGDEANRQLRLSSPWLFDPPETSEEGS